MGMAKVQLISKKDGLLKDIFEVPANDSGMPTPQVIIHQGHFFLGPEYPHEGATHQTYTEVECYAVP